MRKEKIKYYDSSLVRTSEIVRDTFIIAIVFLISFLLGYAVGSDKVKELKEKNYNQFVEIDNLKETINNYERGEL